MAWPRPPPSADVRPAPCRLCPVLRLQCEQCWLARRGVAHCCAPGHAGHLAAVAGAAASSRVLQAWLAPGATTGAARQAPLRGVGTGGRGPPPAAGLPLAQPTGTAAEYSALGGESPPPPPPRDPMGVLGGGGGLIGRRASVAWDSWGWEGSYAAPPPLPPTLAPSVAAPPLAAEPGAVHPMSDVFSVISRALTASRAPPPPPPPPVHYTGEGWGGGVGSMMGEAPASAPHYPPPFRPHRRPRRCSRRETQARVH